MCYFGSGYTSVEDIRVTIYKLENCFKTMKEHTRQGLERLGQLASVRVVVHKLTDLRADEKREHKVFLESNVSTMFLAADHLELFAKLNLYWDYLAYHLLDHLIREFSIREAKGVNDEMMMVKDEMEQYKIHLKKFRTATPLRLFCQAQRNDCLEPKDEFKKVVAKFNWPEDKTLEVVEDFRQDYARYYCLHECAMMLIELKIGSFLITWFVPDSIVESLMTKVPEMLLLEFNVTKLEIAGDLVYSVTHHQNVSKELRREGERGREGAILPFWSQVSVQDYDFVQKPPEKFLCPILYGPLLQPQQTKCCRKNLSEEASTRIQREGRPCPMCRDPSFITILNFNLRNQVRKLHVFCHHKKTGCGWEGELSALDPHVQSCSNKPSMKIMFS